MTIRNLALVAATVCAVGSLHAADPAWPPSFAADYAAHVAAVRAAGTTEDEEAASAALPALSRAFGRSPGYGTDAEPFDARFFVIVSSLPVRLSNPSGFVLFVR